MTNNWGIEKHQNVLVSTGWTSRVGTFVARDPAVLTPSMLGAGGGDSHVQPRTQRGVA